MKRILTTLLTGALSTLTMASVWQEQQLSVQRAEPAPMMTEPMPISSYSAPNTAMYTNAPHLPASVSLEYLSHKAKFSDDIDADLDGFAIGLSSTPQRNGLWTKLEVLSNSDFDADYYEFSFGGHYNFLSTQHFYAIGTLGVGIGLLDATGFDETIYFAVPVGLEAGLNLTPNFSLFGGIGYKWAIDVSENGETRCNNGSWSGSTGSGTCSWNGGIDYDYVPNYIGDYDGMTYKAGLRYNF
ncbi:hypothetical protein [Acinetobacter radioresistens]|uniref:hypothetical protein n=1 Tax=Acinetobacter radioresistens TaxID=40216 RepID=UPI00125F9F90|nr:hypothetical protein [Acinetobacter radioresistens]